MKRQFLFLCTLLLASATVTMISCDKDDDPTPLTLSTLVAGDVDMNGATAPNNVATNPTIVATFSTNVDATTAVAANIMLIRDYDDATIASTITVSEKSITIVPTETLASGALHELTFTSGLKSTDGEILESPVVRTFTTDGFFAPSGMVAYWSFESTADDVVGSFDPASADVIGVEYVDSRNSAAGKAASFNGSTTIIEVPNGDQLMTTSDFSLSFWVKTNSADKTNGHFVMGLGGWNGFQFEIFGAYDGCKLAAQYDFGNGTSGSEDLWFNGSGDLGWQGWTFCKDLTASGGLEFLIKDKWAHIICVYNSATKVGTMYINGEKMKSQDFNLWPDGDAKKGVVGLKYNGSELGNYLAFGFIQGRNNRVITDTWADYADPANNHFKGLLDDIRIFHKPLTETEIQLMYNSEKP